MVHISSSHLDVRQRTGTLRKQGPFCYALTMTNIESEKEALQTFLNSTLESPNGRYSSEGWRQFYSEGDEGGGFEVVDVIEGDDRRWSRADQIIVKSLASDEYYSFVIDRGLTEYQEDELLDDNVKHVHKVEKTVVVIEWEEVDK